MRCFTANNFATDVKVQKQSDSRNKVTSNAHTKTETFWYLELSQFDI